jgi:16S rRNA (adenine1518-N6/adenine1519-N6)-dimethyltransferase
MSSSNQTLTFLQRRFAEVGLRPKIQHGQNFLVDLNLVRLLVETAELGPQDVVLEVGCGTGSLTALMAPQVAHVVSAEIDPQLYQLASEELIDRPNVTLLAVDALRRKHELNPALMDEVRARLAEAPGRQFKLAANLPYHVATPVISNLLAAEPTPRTMTVTIQKELAERIVALPGTKDYSALSIWVQCQCRARIVRVLPPTVFWPRPKVHSAIVHIELADDLRARVRDRAWFHEFVRTLFLHRRKLLRGVLAAAFKQFDKPAIDVLLAGQGLGPTARAEELDVETLLRLSEAVRTTCR